MTVRATRNGPVLDALAPELDDVTERGHVLALKWTALSSDDTTVEAGYLFTRARSMAEFDAAARFHVTPMQSMVVADVKGNIGMIAPARVPIRKPGHETMGLLPAPGWKADNDWAGFIPHEGLPRTVNPSRGYIATANNRIVPENFPYYISSSWDPPYRAARIEQMIESRRDHDVASFETMLADTMSLFAAEALPYLRAVEPDSDMMAKARDLLIEWDGTMAGAASQPLIFHAWLRRLHERLYGDELGELAGSAQRRRETFIINALSGEAAAAKWCDDVTTDSVESCADIVRLALGDGLADLEEMFGSDMDGWRWDVAHPVVNGHMPLGSVPLLRRLFDIERPSAGGPYTVNRGQTREGARPFANVHAAGYRAIFDFADLDRSRFVISTGQSGNPASPWYDTFATLWAQGGHIPMTTRRDDILDGSIGTLRLLPAAGPATP